MDLSRLSGFVLQRLAQLLTFTITTRSNMTNASHRFFTTSELIDQVLLHVEWQQLYALRRVNRQFKAIITTSVHHKQKMRLLPGVLTAVEEDDMNLRPPRYQGDCLMFAEGIVLCHVENCRNRFVVRCDPLGGPENADLAAWMNSPLEVGANESWRAMRMVEIERLGTQVLIHDLVEEDGKSSRRRILAKPNMTLGALAGHLEEFIDWRKTLRSASIRRKKNWSLGHGRTQRVCYFQVKKLPHKERYVAGLLPQE